MGKEVDTAEKSVEHRAGKSNPELKSASEGRKGNPLDLENSDNKRQPLVSRGWPVLIVESFQNKNH